MAKIVRPVKFSDPNLDFTEPGASKVLRDILKKRDDEITLMDFLWIFNGCLPAGTYEECLYFVRPALDRISAEVSQYTGIWTQQLDEALSLLPDLCIWVRVSWEELVRDGYVAVMRDRICGIMDGLLERNIDDGTVADTISEMNKWPGTRFGSAYMEERIILLDRDRARELRKWVAYFERLGMESQGNPQGIATGTDGKNHGGVCPR